MNIATSTSASGAFHRKPSQRATLCGSLVGVATALAAAALLVATSANSQTAEPAGTEPASAAARAATLPLPAPQAQIKPRSKYTPQDITRAFGFIDSNQDGKISREEAAAFRNVAKHFDAADTNKDQSLSRAEFESALNRRKSR